MNQPTELLKAFNSPTQAYALTKQYYSISEVAHLFNVSTSLLRYWEKEFYQLKPQKSSQGIRKYSQANISQFRLIYGLLKEQGYTIRGAKEALKNNHKKLQDKYTLITNLKTLRSFLVALQEHNPN